MKNSIKVLIAGISLAVLSGCANTKAVTSQDIYYTSEKVNSQHKFSNNIEVDKLDGFLETSKNLFSEAKTSNLNEAEARRALEKSLDEAGMLSNGSADYLLDISLIDADLASLMSDRMEEREITIRYTLKNPLVNTVYKNVITGRGENEIGFIGFQWKEEHITATRAYRDVLRQLIEDLKDL